MKDSQPVWPPRTFERIFTVLLVLIGLYALFLGAGLIFNIAVVLLVIGAVCVAAALLWFGGKLIWDALFGR
jgi:hypothetical protein